jgi:tetratricopeptide (TPR) repeat protein
VISQSGNLARILGRFDEAVALGRRATEIDPLIAGRYHNAGLALYYAGLQPEAIAAFRKALELAPDRERTHSMLAAVFLEKGLPDEALVEARQEKNPIFQLWSMALAQHALRRENESSASLTQLIARYRADAPYHIATVYAFRGETDRAIAWLERAYAVRDSGITLIKGDPLLKTLVGDPRYAPLLQKIGLPR